MLLRLVWPSLRRNAGRTAALMLQFAVGTAVATLALHLMLQEREMVRDFAAQWGVSGAMRIASIDATVSTPPDVATVRYLAGAWRPMRPTEGLRLGATFGAWEAGYVLVNNSYLDLVRPAMAAGQWLTLAQWKEGEPIPVVLSAAAASRVAPDASALGMRLGVKQQLLVVGVLNRGEAVLVQAAPAFHLMIDRTEPLIILPASAESALAQTDLKLASNRSHNRLTWFGNFAAEALPAGAHAWRLDETMANTRLMYQHIWGPLNAVALVLVGLAAVGFTGVSLAALERRWREFGIRAALGATPLAMAQQLLLEVMIVTAAGGLIGALIGAGTVRLLPGEQPGIIWAVPLYTWMGAWLLGALIALAPLQSMTRMRPDLAIRQHSM